MAKYDTEELKITPRYIEALKQLMWAEMEMMRLHEPDMADCWTWAICKIGDLSNSNRFSFEFGGEDDKPEDFPKVTDVWIKGI